MSEVKIERLLEWIVTILAIEIMLLTLLKPAIKDFTILSRYKGVSGQNTTANATVRSVKLKKPWIGGCYLSINYDFLANGKMYQGLDRIGCKYIAKVVVNNTVTTYYDPAKPENSATEISLASSKLDLFSDTFQGIILTLAISSLCFWANRSPQLRKKIIKT